MIHEYVFFRIVFPSQNFERMVFDRVFQDNGLLEPLSVQIRFLAILTIKNG